MAFLNKGLKITLNDERSEKTAEFPPIPADAIPGRGASKSDPPQTGALPIVGAVIVILLTLLGVAYLGYQLFVHGH